MFSGGKAVAGKSCALCAPIWLPVSLIRYTVK